MGDCIGGILDSRGGLELACQFVDACALLAPLLSRTWAALHVVTRPRIRYGTGTIRTLGRGSAHVVHEISSRLLARVKLVRTSNNNHGVSCTKPRIKDSREASSADYEMPSRDNDLCICMQLNHTGRRI
jgi:hypothetical protein